MITDISIREQGYTYFLAEAPELLQTIEQELFSLSTGYSTNKVHNLMRATHTIKGGAANVGLDIIKEIAHSLEDIFQALYNPQVVIDEELQTLLLETYECLRLALTAEFTNTNINREELRQRADLVFNQLQEKLGDAFDGETHIPTSEELGFDIVQSIFEVGVKQRLDSMAKAINNCQNSTELGDFFRSQVEVFIGLAESLNLPGFGDLSQTIFTALTANPHQVEEIAKIALADLQQAQQAVLAGDRTSGGTVSPTLAKFITATTTNPSATTFFNHTAKFYQFLTTSGIKPVNAKFYLKVIRYIFGWFNHYLDIPPSELRLDLLIPPENWLQEFLNFLPDPVDSQSLCLYRQGAILTVLLAVAKFQYSLDQSPDTISIIEGLRNQTQQITTAYKNSPPITTAEINWLDSSKLQDVLVPKEVSTDSLLESIWGGEISSDSQATDLPAVENVSEAAIEVISDPAINKITHRPVVRVEVEGLQRLNYLTGELLVYQKRQSLQDEHIQELIERLAQLLTQHQTTLNQLRDFPQQKQIHLDSPLPSVAAVNFDSLEMDVYTEFNLTLHEATEEALQLQETIESLDLLINQTTQIGDKKQHLILGIIDNLAAARMLPLGSIVSRFSQMINKLAEVHGKPVELKLTGTEVLVDKAIAEKLYEPLLHLVRNAFDHGIEPLHIRRESGKPEQGLIEISAYHQGSQTIIEVRDDGQGLNLESISRKAMELNPNPKPNYSTNPTESELLELIFSPGFTTAGKVSEISGRGMGLSIVQTQMQALNGSISIKSLPHQGTTFTLKIPFSMTTDKLMLVEAGGVAYALLLDSIDNILIPSASQIQEFEGKQVLCWQENMVGLRNLGELMTYNGYIPNGNNYNQLHSTKTEMMKKPVLFLRRNQNILGLEVDQIFGEQELVIRPLGSAIAPPKYVYGCSSLANGNLILVIDGTLLVESSEMQATLLPSNKSSWLISGHSTPSTPLLSASTSETYKLPKVVLVVDDAISLRQTLTLTLQKSGYQVVQAQNGIEALEQLQLHPQVHIIISDLEMPRMNGFELLSNLRQNPNFAHIPLVVLTSRSAEKHRQLSLELGAAAYITKPYLEHEFLSTIENLVSN